MSRIDMSRYCVVAVQTAGLFQATTKEKDKMFSIRFLRAGSILAVPVLYLLVTVNAFAAAVAISPSQLALYQGADRQKILIEGAKKEEAFTLYDSHTWFRTIAKEFEKKYPFIKVSEFR